jgi:hypothetical protein
MKALTLIAAALAPSSSPSFADTQEPFVGTWRRRPSGDWCSVAGIGHLLNRDPTLNDCADLPDDFEAEGAAPGSVWIQPRSVLQPIRAVAIECRKAVIRDRLKRVDTGN